MAGTVLLSLPVLRVLGHRYGLVGVWLSLVFVQGMRAVGFAWRLYRVRKYVCMYVYICLYRSALAVRRSFLSDRQRKTETSLFAIWTSSNLINPHSFISVPGFFSQDPNSPLTLVRESTASYATTTTTSSSSTNNSPFRSGRRAAAMMEMINLPLPWRRHLDRVPLHWRQRLGLTQITVSAVGSSNHLLVGDGDGA